MKEILFVTNNPNKVAEISYLLPDGIKLIGLSEINFNDEIEETAETIEGNSLIKVLAVRNLYGKPCFAEDTGLEVEALGGQPGVKSARFSGEGRCNQDNINRVLSLMKGKSERNARFRTVLTFFDGTSEIQFEGICNGSIIEAQRGEKGFGYDSIFVPQGSNRTFAEMDLEEKNKFSHRKKAFCSFIDYLQKMNSQKQPL